MASLLRASLRVILPPLLGAAGALTATLLPVYHAAFCGVPPLGF